ncbi:ABC transporter ATP-binding protein, partial [Pseudomonas syringae pv. tagetis]
TFLDLAQQKEVQHLLRDLNPQEGKTNIKVLHDQNLDCRYADHKVAVHELTAYAQGRPPDILREALDKQIYGLNYRIIT